MAMRMAAAILVLAALGTTSTEAAVVGSWTFEGSNPLADSAGNFPDLLLQGTAAIVGGRLDVNGTGTSATGWAVTNSLAGSYAGPAITNKTLVSWVILQSLSAAVSAGSAITLDSVTVDNFDGIIFAEVEADRWMSGSSNFLRTQNFAPGFQETGTGTMIQMAITYEDLGDGNMRITGYRNCTQIGQYTTGNASSWDPGDAEVFFGQRHGTTAGGPGALDALIEEARLYDEVLTGPALCALTPVSGVRVLEAWHLAALLLLLVALGAVSLLPRQPVRV